MPKTEEHRTAGSSRVSSTIFFLLCFIPCVGAVLFGAVDSITWAMLCVLTAVILVLWSVGSWADGELPIAFSSLQLPLVALILIGLIQLLPLGAELPAALITTPSSRALSLDAFSTRIFIQYLVVFLIFFSAALTFINSAERVRKVGLLIVLFGGSLAFYGILQHIAAGDAIYGLRKPFQANPFGPFVNEHHFAGFMEMTAGVTLGIIFGSSRKEKKFLYGIALVVMVAAIVLTGSRGGLMSICGTAAFAGVLSFVFRTRYDRKGVAKQDTTSKLPAVLTGVGIAAAVVLLVLFLGGDDSLTRGLGFADTGDDLSHGRTHFWSVALQIFAHHPIIGAGFESFGVAFTRYDTWNGIFRVEQAHNDYLQTLADAGILGLLAVIGFIFLLFKKGLETIGSAERGFRRDVAIGSLAGCVGILIHSFVDFPLRTWSNSFFFLLLAACATVTVGADVAPAKRRKRRST